MTEEKLSMKQKCWFIGCNKSWKYLMGRKLMGFYVEVQLCEEHNQTFNVLSGENLP